MLFGNLAVLVVDDEALIRMGAAYMLSDAGAVFEAGDAAEALLVLEAHDEIMLVFTDVNMPGDMDGVALATAVYGMKPKIQWIVTSGRERFSAGDLPDHASFLPKPYRQAELLNLVSQKLEAIA